MVVIVYILISYLCWSLAAICNAITDTLIHHYYISIFYKPNNIENTKWTHFFNPQESKLPPTIIPFTKYKLDAWHVFKSLMIILQALSNGFMFLVGIEIVSLYSSVLSIFILLVVYGIIWNGTFNLFYNRILITKK